MDVDQVERKITPRTRGDSAGPSLRSTGRPGAAPGNRQSTRHSRDRGRRPGPRRSLSGSWSRDARPLAAASASIPGKNLGAYGEAGAIVTHDDRIATRLRSLRDHAQSQRYHHDEIGFNYRMDAFQGAVLGIKLTLSRSLDRSTPPPGRIAIASGSPTCRSSCPTEALDLRHVWHLFVVLHPERDRLRDALEARGIQHRAALPGTGPPSESVCPPRLSRWAISRSPSGSRGECLTLPLFPEMTESQQDRVVDALREVLREEQA